MTAGLYTPSGPIDMEGEGIPKLHVQGIDMDRRARPLTPQEKETLPEPILSENREWLELYWRAWAIVFQNKFTPPAESGFVPFVDEGFSSNIFQWDTCFMLSYLRYAVDSLPVYGTLDNFYSKQHEDGYICREINQLTGQDFWSKDQWSTINPPLFSWAEVGLLRLTGDIKRAQKVLPHLERYYEWLERNRRHEDGVAYWTTSLSSGMDNTPRAFDKGGTDVHHHHNHVWMCMTAQQALNAECIAILADVVGEEDTRMAYQARYKQLSDYIEAKLWNSNEGFYFDLDPDQNWVRTKTPASFWPLLAGTSSSTRAQKTAAKIFDPEEFWRPHALPSLSKKHELYHPRGNYWHGGIWPPLTYLTSSALHRYNLHQEATKLIENHLENLWLVFQETGTLWENYAPEEPTRGNISKPEFVGWTGNGPIAALIETILGFDVNVLKKQVTWRLQRSDHHGIRNLPFAGNRISFEYFPDENYISASSDQKLTLVLDRESGAKKLDIPAGVSKHPL